MTFEQLLYAEVLSHHPTLQAAADILHISKSGLSLAIAQLEDELGIQLFERTSKGTVVTMAGLQTLSAITDVLRSKNMLMKTAFTVADQQRHQIVSIRYMNTMLTPFITTFLDSFREEFPDAHLDIRRNERVPILQAIRNHEIDAGFIVIPANPLELGEGLRFEQVCHSHIVMVCSAENELLKKTKVTFDDLKTQRYCMFNDESHDYIFNQLQYMCGPLPLVLCSDDSWAIHEAVCKLNAVCFSRTILHPLSREHTFDDLKTIPISHLVDDSSHMGWVTNAYSELSPPAKKLIGMITEEIKKRAPQ